MTETQQVSPKQCERTHSMCVCLCAHTRSIVALTEMAFHFNIKSSCCVGEGRKECGGTKAGVRNA